jgi:hypothetical protein
MKKFIVKSKGKLLSMCIGLLFASCEKDLAQRNGTDSERSAARAIFANIDENWNNYDHATTYPNSLYEADFGNNLSDGSWKSERTYISNGTLRLTLLANQVGAANGGVIGKTDIADGLEYQVKFRVKFHTDFQFSKGGKVGLGLGMGQVIAGCEGLRAQNGEGGSARLMWNRVDVNGVTCWKFKPYIYHKRMTGTCGGESVFYPSGTNNIEKNVWYTVIIRAKSNTAGSDDGTVFMSIQKAGDATATVLLNNRATEWGTGDYNRKITTLMFDTFRGGASTDSTWESSTDGYIYFDDVDVDKLN